MSGASDKKYCPSVCMLHKHMEEADATQWKKLDELEKQKLGKTMFCWIGGGVAFVLFWVFALQFTIYLQIGDLKANSREIKVRLEERVPLDKVLLDRIKKENDK